ncbi:MAG TPA: amidohydrolase, partial [Acidimicrobiaceae bacterium]|nr:amidohydrolase [Acidimicrobiaceae bacterium]
MSYDLIITGGKVVDGTGSAPYNADVGVKDGLIAKVGDLSGAESVDAINAENRIVTPGF